MSYNCFKWINHEQILLLGKLAEPRPWNLAVSSSLLCYYTLWKEHTIYSIWDLLYQAFVERFSRERHYPGL
jgi:hypothetical protein